MGFTIKKTILIETRWKLDHNHSLQAFRLGANIKNKMAKDDYEEFTRITLLTVD